jgi:Uma2 family endonuclease
MTIISPPISSLETIADLLRELGDIPAWRVRLTPSPGSATEADVLHFDAREDRLYELVDGTLVEKGMGYLESVLATFLIMRLGNFINPKNLGLLSGESGMMRLFPGLVRIPDVAFVSWPRIPGGKFPTAPIPDLVPDLAVEILSASNTVREMNRKRSEYFDAGVSLVWIIDPDARTVAVYHSPADPIILTTSDTLDGGDVLPGFTVSLKEFFAELDRVGLA